MTFPVKTTCSKFTEGEDHQCLVVTTLNTQKKAGLRLGALPVCCTVNSIKSELNPLLYFPQQREDPLFTAARISRGVFRQFYRTSFQTLLGQSQVRTAARDSVITGDNSKYTEKSK